VSWLPSFSQDVIQCLLFHVSLPSHSPFSKKDIRLSLSNLPTFFGYKAFFWWMSFIPFLF
jgi:hypothetical protein